MNRKAKKRSITRKKKEWEWSNENERRWIERNYELWQDGGDNVQRSQIITVLVWPVLCCVNVADITQTLDHVLCFMHLVDMLSWLCIEYVFGVWGKGMERTIWKVEEIKRWWEENDRREGWGREKDEVEKCMEGGNKRKKLSKVRKQKWKGGTKGGRGNGWEERTDRNRGGIRRRKGVRKVGTQDEQEGCHRIRFRIFSRQRYQVYM